EIFNAFDQLIKSYVFNYDYTGKLYLDSIDEYDKSTQEHKPYNFEYQPKIPAGAINDQDFWGFYNAAGNNNLIPVIYAVNNPYGQYQSDRLPNEAAMKKGVLKKITYPAKGSSEFYFEAHKAFTPEFEDPYSPFLLNNKEDITLNSTQGAYKEELFSIETLSKQSILFEIDFTYFREEYNTNRPAAYLQKYENGEWTEIMSWWPSYPSLEDESFDTVVELFPGDYRFILTDIPCVLAPCYVAQPDELEKIFVTYAKFSYLENSDADLKNQEITAGGLRIQKIINRDAGGAIISQKKYTYEQGKLITFPIHYSYYDQEIYDAGFFDPHLLCWMGTNISDYRIHTISSSSMAVLGAAQGSHVIYSKVVEEKTDANDQNNGSIAYQYYVPDNTLQSPNNIPSEPPFAPQDDISDIASKLNKKITFNRNGDTIQKIIYNYSFLSPETPSHKVKGLSISKKKNRVIATQNQNCSVAHLVAKEQSYFFHYAFYDIETSWIKLNAVITTDFDDQGENPLTTTLAYFYDNEIHLQPTHIETTTNNGEVIETRIYYPDDILSVADLPEGVDLSLLEYTEINKLKKGELHRIGEPIQKAIYRIDELGNQHLVSLQRTLYRDFNGLILPEKIQTSIGQELLEDKIVYTDYDNFGSPLELSKADGTPVSYIWGYQNTKPITKLEGISYVDIDPATIANLQTLSDNDTDTLSEQTLRDALHLLYDTYPDAVITSFTYDPLIGMTSMTDFRGETIFYTYDTFNRLEATKDPHNDIMKSYNYNYAQETPPVYAPLNVGIDYGSYTNDHQWFTAIPDGGSGDFSYAWFEGIGNSSTDFEATPSGTNSTYQFMVSCGQLRYVKLVVTDTTTGEIVEAVEANNNSCDYPPLNAAIGYGSDHNDFQWFISTVSGGSGNYSYAWYEGIGSSNVDFANTPLGTAPSYQLFIPCTTYKYVKLVVTDTVTGLTVIKIKNSDNFPCSGGDGGGGNPGQPMEEPANTNGQEQ
ncbi:MAG: hypothetical protein AAF934_07795, partial [Bacteroidota bacterium]